MQNKIYYLFVLNIVTFGWATIYSSEQVLTQEEKLQAIKKNIANIRNLKKEIIKVKNETTQDLTENEVGLNIFKKLHRLSNNCLEIIDDIYQEMDNFIHDDKKLSGTVDFSEISWDMLYQEYQTIKDEIDLEKAKQAQPQATSIAAQQKAEEDEKQARIKLEESYGKELQALMALASLLEEQIESEQELFKQKEEELSKATTVTEKQVAQEEIKKVEDKLEKVQKLHEEFEKQQETIKKELKQLESESISKKFMDYVVENYSGWLKDLPDNKQIFQDSVRKVLGENFTNAQVLYSQGFLQALKL